MSREKLRRLGIDLPLFPTTSVGSFPKPDYLLKARADYAKNTIPREALEAAERRATEFWIRTQDELGVDVLVDGEMYRGDMVAYFAEHMDGFEEGGLVRSYGNRYYHKPIIVSDIRWKKPITVEWWNYTQSLTERPVKGMLTGPYTVMDWSFNEHYPDRRAVSMALAKEIRKEVEALIQAGAKIIQIDEPASSVRPEELQLIIDSMKVVTEGQPAYFISHLCYGAFETIYPGMLDLAVDNLDLEMSNSGLDMLALFKKHRYTKDISFGVVDVHSHVVEAEPVVAERLRQALEVIPPDALWVDPDCGLKTRTVEEAVEKMKTLVAAARALRN
jgi:5-methyltetrahydropteroyltriglutamate--homocysteine methyltransferase